MWERASAIVELFYILLVLLAVTRLFGEVAARFHQAVLVGELLAGVALGVLVQSFGGALPALSGLPEDEVFHAITDLGIYFLMLLAGIEMRPRDLYSASRPALWVAGGGMLVPVGLGLAIGWLMIPDSSLKPAQMLFLAVSLAITAVPVTIAALMELDLHRSRIGKLIVSAAVFDDLFSLFLLAILTSFIAGGEVTVLSMAALGGQVLVLFLAIWVVAAWLFPVVGRLAMRLEIQHAEFSILMLFALGLSVLAEVLDMHFILGAYAAGLVFTRKTMNETVHRDLLRTVKTITYGFFAPLFFASIGLSVRLDAVTGAPVFLVLLLVAAFLGKLVGSGAAALWSGFSRRSALAVGMGMNARGAVEMIVAGIALDAGLFATPDPPGPVVGNMFSAVVIVAILTTVVSPMALRAILPSGGAAAR